MINWWLGEVQAKEDVFKNPKTTDSQSLWARYVAWTAKHRVRLLPISGTEESVLILPISYALGVLQYVTPILMAYRLLALTLRLIGNRRNRLEETKA